MAPATDAALFPCFHALESGGPDPVQLNNPFCYRPHALCLEAAAQVRAYIECSPALAAAARQGKMLGVLAVRAPGGQRGFLAAYSGLLGGRNDWPFFVPPVFDAQQPDGHFKQGERRISALNARIDTLRHSSGYLQAQQRLHQCRSEAAQQLEAERQAMRLRKAQRDRCRAEGHLSAGQAEALVRESQHDKAELRRLRQALMAREEAARQEALAQEEALQALRSERRRQSEALQRWLFSRYRVYNALGQSAALPEIFGQWGAPLPPAGAGDCCAPKLLQYAYIHGCRPLALAEFWYGAPDTGLVRLPGHFYPACRGKCRPILHFMLQGLDVEADRSTQRPAAPPRVVFADGSLAVVDKPWGMLSVPGREAGRPSAEAFVRQHFGVPEGQPVTVHRLDMDTSGLLVFALTRQAHKALQQQFIQHTVEKRYEALLEGTVQRHDTPCVQWDEGTVRLPLRPDPLNRPLQTADLQHGHKACTRFRLEGTDAEGRQRVSLWPLTGRTHQLRVHCAHPYGLACPIAGDPLYGHGMPGGGRLCLHAAALSLTHPVTGQRLTFTSEPGF